MSCAESLTVTTQCAVVRFLSEIIGKHPWVIETGNDNITRSRQLQFLEPGATVISLLTARSRGTIDVAQFLPDGKIINGL